MTETKPSSPRVVYLSPDPESPGRYVWGEVEEGVCPNCNRDVNGEMTTRYIRNDIVERVLQYHTNDKQSLRKERDDMRARLVQKEKEIESLHEGKKGVEKALLDKQIAFESMKQTRTRIENSWWIRIGKFLHLHPCDP